MFQAVWVAFGALSLIGLTARIVGMGGSATSSPVSDAIACTRRRCTATLRGITAMLSPHYERCTRN
jgi:hypothetical protein